MSEEDSFEFRRRARGVVWVCDIADSSKYLNDNETADYIEKYIPRLHWLAMTFVEAAGGKFIKWTGDGFLAWFEMDLHRELEGKVAGVLNALWHLTVFNNVTRLGLPLQVKFRLRHGVTYEQDALVSTINYPGGYRAMDLMGRSVVLAFRLAGVPADFPAVTTQGEIAAAHKSSLPMKFGTWLPGDEDCLRYFKGETWGTTSLVRSEELQRERPATWSEVTNRARQSIDKAEGGGPVDTTFMMFAVRFQEQLQRGPSWAQEAMGEYLRYIKEDLLGLAQKIVQLSTDMANSGIKE
jgi:hypothetical protein